MTGGDREKLAREAWQAYHAYTRGPDPDIEGDRVLFYTLADIAIAYADRRVAEAVRKMAANSARIIFTKSSDFDAIKRIRDLADAISPAREGGKP